MSSNLNNLLGVNVGKIEEETILNDKKELIRIAKGKDKTIEEVFESIGKRTFTKDEIEIIEKFVNESEQTEDKKRKDRKKLGKKT